MSGRSILVDVNIWLASIVENHPHHRIATQWWISEVLPQHKRVAFCRLTQLGLLRLLTNATVMGDRKRSLTQAYGDYQQLAGQETVFLASEPDGLENLLAGHCKIAEASRNFWTDAYLAAFAQAAKYQLATLDRGFQRFPDLDLRLLA